MKNLIKFFMVMAVLCMIGCSQTFEDISNNAKPQEKTQGRLVMNVGNRSRTIMPIIAADDIKSATLTANDTEIGRWSWSGDNGDNVINQIKNDNSILLDVGIYNFEMVFCNGNSDVILIGTINNQEIKNGNNSLTFDMQISTTGKGNISIELSREADSGISKIKAGLYDIATGEAVAGYEAEEIVINGTVAGYIKENVQAGQYIIKFEVYDTSDKLLNTLTEVINVAAGITTSSQITLSKINTQYSITYNLNGGKCRENFTLTYKRNANEKIILPKAEHIIKDGYEFGGWYDDDNNRITEIPSDTAKNISVTAKWYNDICTVSEAKNVILALSGEGPYDIAVTGEITNVNLDIQAIKDGLNGNKGAKVNLDLSQTTGWDKLPVWSFEGCINLTSITIPDSVTFIGDTTFQNCRNLTSINIPNGVTSIDKNTFNGCSSLTEIIIPDSVTSIAYNAFYLCDSVKTLETGNGLTSLDYLPITSALESITIGDSITEIGAEKFKDFTKLKSVTFADNSKLTKIGDSAFSHCSQLTSITFPESVTTIGNNVFDKCFNLTNFIVHEQNQYFSTLEDGKILCDKNKGTLIAYPSARGNITIPDGITTIAGNAFVDCTELTDITIPNSVISIGNGAFGRTGFTSVKLPDSVTAMGTDVFAGCSSLENVTLSNSITSIPRATFFMCHNLSEIVIPSSVTSIGDIAFSACYALTSIDIPDSVTTIERNAFSDCSGLESVTIGNGVTSIGETAFGGCYSVKTLVIGNSLPSLDYLPITSALESITIGNSITEIGDNKFKDFTNLKSVTFADNSQLTKIGENAFCDCSQLTEITIPDGVQTISKGAFGRTGFTSVQLPDSVIEMGTDIFSECSNLETVKLPKNITSIPRATFYECTNLTSIVIPDGVTSIGDSAFSYCSQLTSITFPESVTTIGINVFDACSELTSFIVHESNRYFLTLEDGKILCDNNKGTLIAYPSARGSITIPDGITTIAGNAFVDCTELTDITIPNSVTSIGNGAFGRTGFTSVKLPDSITQMGIDVFCGCSSLETVTLSNSITSIPKATFFMCYKLSEIVIPSSVTSIGESAFSGCNNLTTVNYKGTEDEWNQKIISGIGSGSGNEALTNATINYNHKVITVTSDNVSTEISKLTEGGSYTIIVTEAIEDTTISAIKEALQKSTAKVNLDLSGTKGLTSIGEGAFDNCSNLTSVVIPADVTSIGNGAFYNCSNLTSVVIPAGVTSIGVSAFQNCGSLTSVTIGNSVTSIGDHAFNGCGLKSVTIGNGVTSIGVSAFCDCHSLTSVTIGDSVTTIGNYAFGNCSNLASVTIGNSVTFIGEIAFGGCYLLTTVNYRGTQDQWEQIVIDSTNDKLINATKTYDYTGN